MKTFYFKTFAHICILPYIGGTIFHTLRLVYDFSPEEIPFEVDWFIIIIGGYAGLGLIVFKNKIRFKNSWDKIAYALLVFHLNGSVIIHAYAIFTGNHDFFLIFPYYYSYIAIAYFIPLGLYVLNLNKRLYRKLNAKPT